MTSSNSMSTNTKTKIKEEIIEQNFDKNINEESQSNLNILCENELDLDQIPCPIENEFCWIFHDLYKAMK